MTKPIPEYALDIFTPDAVRNAREVDDALREFAPVVRLADGTHMLGRHEHVAAGLLDWKAFSSASRPWHDPTSPRPEILLTDDPPRHTQVRKVIADALSPRALERIRGIFDVRAQELLDRAVKKLEDQIAAVGGVENLTEETMPEAHIRGDINTPYRCIGGAVFTMQRAGFARVGFISEPPAGSGSPRL